MKAFFQKVGQWFEKHPAVDWFGVTAALGIFTALAWPTLVGASAYFDEGYSAYLARFNPFSTSFYTAFDVHPPLYYVVLHFWQSIVGTGVEQLRFLTIIFAWVAVLFVFLTVRRWFGRRAAILATFLIVLSPLFIRYGTAMRMYTMMLATAFSATYVLLRATTSKDKRWWRWYTALVAIGMWTNYFMAFVWLAHAVWLWRNYRHDKTLFAKIKKAYFWAVIWYLPWLPILALRYAVVQAYGFWIPPVSIETLASTVTESTVFRSASDTTAWLAVAILTLITGAGVWAKRVYSHLDSKAKPAFRLLGFMSLVPVVLLVAISLPPFRSAYTFRYVIVAAMSGVVLIAVILTHVRLKRYGTPIRIVFIVLALGLFASGAEQTLVNGNRSLDTNWQNRTKQLMEKVHATGIEAPIITRSTYAFYVFRMYPQDGYPIKYLYSNDSEMVRGANRPLFDHKEDSVPNFDGMTRLWLAGDNLREVASPGEGWVKKRELLEYDPSANSLSEAAIYYERS